MDAAAAEQFLAVLEKSSLLTAEQLAAAGALAAESADAAAAARALVQQGTLTRWQAGQLLAGRTAFQWGKYRLLNLLGRGGMGSVFLAQHVTMNRLVALKIVGKELDSNPAAMERFLAEARAIAALDHPNIVRAYNVDKEGDRYYLVMEYVDGRDLQRIVEEKGPLTYAAATDAVRQAAEGLAHAHRRGMIHCDIKPSNLLVNNQGVVKILDMGLARLTRDAEDRPAAADQPLLGTVDYMAPEQAMGSATLDHRADIYSLGCTFYFLLTGRPPFPEGTLAQRIVKHQTQHPASIIAQRADAPRNLVQICRKMMGKTPADRYQSAEEVSRLLAAWDPKSSGLKRAAPLEETAPAPAAADPGSQELDDIVAAAVEGETRSRAAAASAKTGRWSAAWRRWNPLRALGRVRIVGSLVDRQRLVIAIAMLSVILLVVAAVVAIPMILKQPVPVAPGSPKPPAVQDRTAPAKSPAAHPKPKDSHP